MNALPDPGGEAGRWLAQAVDDLRAAQGIAADSDLPARVACFLAHLTAEKALKACRIGSGAPFRKSHDLFDLCRYGAEGMAAMFADADLRMLNPWSIDGRYPADVDDATVAEARECIAAAERILDTATASLRRP